MKRFISLFLSLLLFVSVLSVNALSVFADEKEDEVIPPQISLSVDYDRPKENGSLDVWLTISCDKGNGENAPEAAEDVVLTIQAHELIEIDFLNVTGQSQISHQPDNTYRITIRDLSSGSCELCILSMQVKGMEENGAGSSDYDHSHVHLDDSGEIITPWLKLKLTSKNYGSCEYKCDLDIAPDPKAVVLGWNEEPADNIKNDVDLMEEVWSDCYYNGLPVDVAIKDYNVDWNTVKDQISNLDTDDNDVTYFYVNAHGAVNLKSHIIGENAGYSIEKDGKTYEDNLISYGDLVDAFGSVKGRIVIVLDSCFSGNAIGMARRCLNKEQSAILTSVDTQMGVGAYSSYGWFTNDLVELSGKGSKDFLDKLYELAKDTLLPDFVRLNDSIISTCQEDNVVSVSEAYSNEKVRFIENRANIIIGILGIAIADMAGFIDSDEFVNTGINPQVYGNDSLPLFVLTEDPDDGKVIIAVKNEEYNEYPPSVRGEVVFSFDPYVDFAGTMTVYVLNEDGHLVKEASESSENWTFRKCFTDHNFGYRPAPLSRGGGISTRVTAIRLSDSLVLTEWDSCVVAAGPNAPWASGTYTIWHVDPARGIEPVLEGEFGAEYNIAAYNGDQNPESETFWLNGEKCSQEAFFTGFAEYGVGFSYAYIDVTEIMRESVLLAYSEDGEVVLEELRSSVESELPPTYDELTDLYGITE